jgi:alanine racemase
MTSYRPVWAEVDLDAIRHNVRALRATVAPAAVLAVVKADGYGHGAVETGRAAKPASTRRCSCCRNRFPTPPRVW